MILRKPYAFFIKHFKLFNIVLAVLQSYLIYKISFLISFLIEYPSNPMGAIGQDIAGDLITKSIFIVAIIVILFCFILIGILSVKKKPIKLYLLTIIVNILLVILFIVNYSVISTLQLKVLENKLIFAMRDFLIIGTILELVLVVVTCMRAIGFDIKSFSFGKDLEDLNIDVTDNEEFELQIDVDSGNFKRNFNKNKRYFKYFIYEHKFIIVLIATIILGFTSFLIYSRMGIYFNAIKTNKMVNADNFVFGTLDSYITTKDYQGNIISDENTLVVVPINIKVKTSKEKLNVAKVKLVVDKNNYYHVTKYNSKLIDFGISYNDQIITKDFSNYLLVFEVPKRISSKKMYLQYDLSNDKNIKFVIKPNNIDETGGSVTNKLGETIEFKNALINEGILTINSFEISDKFKVDYKFCVTNNECYDSYEYIVPNFKSNYDKTILMINGNINLVDSNIAITNLYEFISNFGSLVYKIDGNTKKQTISFVQVRPTKTKLNDIYYIEILDEVKNAESISLEFNLRNNKYVYVLK